MTDVQTLATHVQQFFGDQISSYQLALDELTLEVPAANLLSVCRALRDEPSLQFSLLVDICGVDYLDYGVSQWQTEKTTLTGFSRAVDATGAQQPIAWDKPRFAIVYHLLSLAHNQRLRLRVFAENDPPIIDSVISIWDAANWYEREAFDLYGILFNGHPDLRRILTDYGFIGHPFRKDFPLIGQVEMRYDATLARCVYEPVSIQPRTLVPKVIRTDPRYSKAEMKKD